MQGDLDTSHTGPEIMPSLQVPEMEHTKKALTPHPMSEIKTYMTEAIVQGYPREHSPMKQWVSLEDHQRAIEAAYKDAASLLVEDGNPMVAKERILFRLEQIKKGVGG